MAAASCRCGGANRRSAASIKCSCGRTLRASSVACSASWAAPLPYVWVPEWHPGGHGAACPLRGRPLVKQAAIREVWARGNVHIKLIGDLPVGSGSLEEARRAAGYLAKSVSKNIGDERLERLNRYEVAQGFDQHWRRCTGLCERAATHGRSPRGTTPTVNPARSGADGSGQNGRRPIRKPGSQRRNSSGIRTRTSRPVTCLTAE